MSNVFESDKDKEIVQETVEHKEAAKSDFLMVGEGKKYKDFNEADKALKHSQEHISHIETENDFLRKQLEELNAKLTSAKTVEDVLSKLEKNDVVSSVETPSMNNAKPTFSDENVLDLVNKALSQREKEALMNKNVMEVKDQLISKFGDRAKDVFNKRQAELGVDLNSLAASSPKAVMEFFHNVKVDVPVKSESSSVNTSNFSTSKIENYQDDPEWKQAILKGDFKKAMRTAEKYIK